MQPIVNGVGVVRCVAVPWEASDDAQLDDSWRVVGRALVEFPQGGLANGLLLKRRTMVERVEEYEYACVIWERPVEGGRGRFRLVPLGDWSSS
jgi:hypothetical protein